MMEQKFIEAWKETLADNKAWVLFKNGTVVVLPSVQDTPEKDAVELLKRDGPVYPGSCHGDFNVVNCKGRHVVTSHNENISTMVLEKESKEKKLDNDMVIGLYGRSKRDADSKECSIIHVHSA